MLSSGLVCMLCRVLSVCMQHAKRAVCAFTIHLQKNLTFSLSSVPPVWSLCRVCCVLATIHWQPLEHYVTSLGCSIAAGYKVRTVRKMQGGNGISLRVQFHPVEKCLRKTGEEMFAVLLSSYELSITLNSDWCASHENRSFLHILNEQPYISFRFRFTVTGKTRYIRDVTSSKELPSCAAQSNGITGSVWAQKEMYTQLLVHWRKWC